LEKKLEDCTILGIYQKVITDKTQKDSFDDGFSAAIVAGNFGKGHVVVFGPHPEASGPKFQNSIKYAVRWCFHRN